MTARPHIRGVDCSLMGPFLRLGRSFVVLARAVTTGIVPIVRYSLSLLRSQLKFLPIWRRNNVNIVRTAACSIGADS